jgi:peptide/nickel transport system permease protein
MINYVARRLLLVIPTVFLVSLIVFFSIRFIPGNVVDIMLAEYEVVTDMDRAAIEHALGFDVPVFTQYGRWLGVLPREDGRFSGILEGDFGNSMLTDTPVIKSIANRWPVTLELGLIAIIVSQIIALPIGIYSALRQDTWGDYIGRSIAILFIAVPGFWLATLVMVYPSIWWGYMPPIMLVPFSEDPIGNLKMFVVPACVLGMSMSGMTMRMTRTMMLEVLRQDYIRTAWAKGLREGTVVLRHALKNALIPVVTIVGLQLPLLIGGTVIIEQIFSLPGMGRLILQATTQRDYTVVSGTMVVFGIGLVLINLLVDLSYGFLDPRVKYE